MLTEIIEVLVEVELEVEIIDELDVNDRDVSDEIIREVEVELERIDIIDVIMEEVMLLPKQLIENDEIENVVV